MLADQIDGGRVRTSKSCHSNSIVSLSWASVIALVQIICISAQAPNELANFGYGLDPLGGMPASSQDSILLEVRARPQQVRANLREFTHKLSDDIKAAANRSGCWRQMERFYDNQVNFEQLDPIKLRDNILADMGAQLVQHRDAVSAIVAEAERAALAHRFNKSLRFNYIDVHRLRNELDPNPPPSEADQSAGQAYGSGSGGQGQGQGGQAGQGGNQFTSINGGTPVPGPPEWQTPVRSLVLQVHPDFGDLPVNMSVSAVHLPLPIYPGRPAIMNGLAWSESLDSVFRRNLAQFNQIHHQYYGDQLGFMRTFPAHKWRIPRLEPDLFDARTRPWYSAGAGSPKDVVILVDASGSMTGLRREIAKGVVFEILDTLTSSDFVSILRFSEQVTPVGLPKCRNLRAPPFGKPALQSQCSRREPQLDARERFECQNFERQWEARGQYLRDHPELVLGLNASYLTDDLYEQAIGNVSAELNGAYLLPATSRNIRQLKTNFSMPTAGIANFTRALMAGFELLQGYGRSLEAGAQCNQAIFLITDGAIRSHEEIFNRYNYPGSPIRVFTFVIGREVGDIRPTKAIACQNRGFYMRVINLSEAREQVLKYLAVMARPLVLAHQHPVSWTHAYGDETYQVHTDWALETKRRERARVIISEDRDRQLLEANQTFITYELTNITEYDTSDIFMATEDLLKNRIVCEDYTGLAYDDPKALEHSLEEELDPLGYQDAACHWSSRKADLIISAVKPVFYNHNTSLHFERVLHKNIWSEREVHMRDARLLGVAAVDLRLADLMRSAQGHLLGPNGYSLLMGHNGFLLHHPDLRPIFPDPYDRQTHLLRSLFGAVDLNHVEQAYSRNESLLATADPANRKRVEELKLIRLRESALKRQMGKETLTLKRAFDCRRRPHVRQASFYYGPVRETPYSFMIALPANYGHNRVSARQELAVHHLAFFQPDPYELWTVHPEFRYCSVPQSMDMAGQQPNGSLETVLRVLGSVSQGSAGGIVYGDLSSPNPARITCDKELFPSLLFDAAATHQSMCYPGTAAHCSATRPAPLADFIDPAEFDSKTNKASQCGSGLWDDTLIRNKQAVARGLELSFVATRSGLTRVRVFELNLRTKKLAKVFIERHNKAQDETWYARTVEWSMKQAFSGDSEPSTLLSVPFNAHLRLVAKLRQRITQRTPIGPNITNCDPQAELPDLQSSSSSTPASEQQQEPQQPQITDQQQSESSSAINNQWLKYANMDSFQLLDLIANSSVHISATQAIIAGRPDNRRSPVAVSGLLYDYANFAHRFLSSTSLRLSWQPAQDANNLIQNPSQVQLCPDGRCPTKCGIRNDTIDCLLLDNNGFIVVAEELVHVGRQLAEYDERLMSSLVQNRIYSHIQLMDYQAICNRTDSSQQQGTSNQQQPQSQQQPNAGPLAYVSAASSPKQMISSLSSNLAAAAFWLWSSAVQLAAQQVIASLWFNLASAQSQRQSQDQLLPNKTFFRPCERPVDHLYELLPQSISQDQQSSKTGPHYYATKCGCSGWFMLEPVPRTNLIMLLVNTSLECRQCSSPPVQTISNFISGPLNQVGSNQPSISSNSEPTEEQICSMLEREASMFVRRPETCFSHHPDESQIKLCGAASPLLPTINFTLLLVLASILAAISQHTSSTV